MSHEKALAQNTAVQIFGKALTTLFGVITIGLLTRFLGDEGYGNLSIAIGFLALFAVIVDFGITLTTLQLISEKPEQEKSIIGNLLSLRIVTAVPFLGIAPIIALFMPYSAEIKLAIAVGVLPYLFGSISSILIGIFQKRLLMNRAIFAEFINRGLVLLGVFLAPQLNLNIVSVMGVFALGNVAQTVMLILYSKKHIEISLKWNSGIIKTILVRSWPIGASIFFNLIYLRGDILFLSFFRSASEIGQYGASYKVVDTLTVLPVMYMGLVLPLLISARKISAEKFNKILQQAFDFFALIAIPISFGGIAISVPLMNFIAGPEFTTAGQVLKLLIPAASIVFFGQLFGHTIIALNKQKQMVFAYAFVAIIAIAGYLIYIPENGIWAAAWWTIISETLISIIAFLVVYKFSKFVPNMKMFFISLVASILMYLSIILIPNINVIFSIIIGSSVFIIVVTLLGGPKPSTLIKLFLPEKMTIPKL